MVAERTAGRLQLVAAGELAGAVDVDGRDREAAERRCGADRRVLARRIRRRCSDAQLGEIGCGIQAPAIDVHGSASRAERGRQLGDAIRVLRERGGGGRLGQHAWTRGGSQHASVGQPTQGRGTEARVTRSAIEVGGALQRAGAGGGERIGPGHPLQGRGIIRGRARERRLGLGADLIVVALQAGRAERPLARYAVGRDPGEMPGRVLPELSVGEGLGSLLVAGHRQLDIPAGRRIVRHRQRRLGPGRGVGGAEVGAIGARAHHALMELAVRVGIQGDGDAIAVVGLALVAAMAVELAQPVERLDLMRAIEAAEQQRLVGGLGLLEEAGVGHQLAEAGKGVAGLAQVRCARSRR